MLTLPPTPTPTPTPLPIGTADVVELAVTAAVILLVVAGVMGPMAALPPMYSLLVLTADKEPGAVTEAGTGAETGRSCGCG